MKAGDQMVILAILLVVVLFRVVLLVFPEIRQCGKWIDTYLSKKQSGGQ